VTARDRIGGEAREEACLALGHVDAERTPCELPADDLVRALVAEVTRLRVQVGAAAWPDPARVVAVVSGALYEVDERQGKIAGEAPLLVELLGDAGWQLLQVRP